MSKLYLHVVFHILTHIKIGFTEAIFCFRMFLSERLDLILSLSQQTFDGLLDSGRSDMILSERFIWSMF